MELSILKYGNLMGSPDLKRMMYELGPQSKAADELWDDLAEIKLLMGQNGQSTSLLLKSAESPLFPALVDCSYMCADPDSYGEKSIRDALDAITGEGIGFDEIKSMLITHPHPDHYDSRLLQHLPNAAVYAHPASKIPGAKPLTPDVMPPGFMSLDTPGHGTPHCSYIIDLKGYDISICIAGDLIMSHAHYLALDAPLSFADREAGNRSVREVKDMLASRQTKYKMIIPGHDMPFFISA